MFGDEGVTIEDWVPVFRSVVCGDTDIEPAADPAADPARDLGNCGNRPETFTELVVKDGDELFPFFAAAATKILARCLMIVDAVELGVN